MWKFYPRHNGMKLILRKVILRVVGQLIELVSNLGKKMCHWHRQSRAIQMQISFECNQMTFTGEIWQFLFRRRLSALISICNIPLFFSYKRALANDVNDDWKALAFMLWTPSGGLLMSKLYIQLARSRISRSHQPDNVTRPHFSTLLSFP